VFKLSPEPSGGCPSGSNVGTGWCETVLYSFTGTGGDGEGPVGGLVRDAKGNLYGTTEYGGDLSCNAPDGCGTAFKFDTTTGKETVLYSFTGSPEASQPHGGLVEDAQGNLYGTTPDVGAYGYGAVYEVDAANKETVLYSFTGGADGGNPTEKLVRDAQGNLYGTTFDNNGAYGGTVFKLSPEPSGGCPSGSNVGTGWCETVLYSFTGTGRLPPRRFNPGRAGQPVWRHQVWRRSDMRRAEWLRNGVHARTSSGAECYLD